MFQMNPENPDFNKINSCDYIIVDGNNIRKGKIMEVIGKSLKLMQTKGFFLLVINSKQKDNEVELISLK